MQKGLASEQRYQISVGVDNTIVVEYENSLLKSGSIALAVY